jgi:hypothetical protein
LDKEQIRILVKDSCERARKFVPDPQLREKICKEAKAEIRKNSSTPLSKQQLERLDRHFLAQNARKPDAEIVRWVLRCAGLHPQGRVSTG